MHIVNIAKILETICTTKCKIEWEYYTYTYIVAQMLWYTISNVSFQTILPLSIDSAFS